MGMSIDEVHVHSIAGYLLIDSAGTKCIISVYMQTQRLNITLPSTIARDLRRTIPARSRSKFIAEALEDKLKRKKNLKRDLIKSLKANRELDKQIMEDFKYADAEALKYIP